MSDGHYSGGAYPYYYVGSLAVASQLVPVCFYMGPNAAGSINFIFDIVRQAAFSFFLYFYRC